MTATDAPVSERQIAVTGKQIRIRQDGAGDQVVVLHHSTGSVGWIELSERLAQSFAVAAPDLPGWGQSDRPEWARDPRDIAILMNRMLDRLDISDVTLVGLGFGGFIAAEMATMSQVRLKAMVLVGAAGLQPDEGEITDQTFLSLDGYVQAGYHDEALFKEHYGEEIDSSLEELWSFSREMTYRVTWEPYMFSRRLPHLLTEVEVPTLLIWGEHDGIVPLICAQQYQRALQNAKLEVVPDAGHLVEMEQPAVVAELIRTHLNGL